MGNRVLLIEDEPNIAQALDFILSRDGWDVAIHPEGTGAIEAIRAIRPDVVVLDVMLPGRSGYDILADLRDDDALAALPVLVLSAAGQGRAREAAARAGASRFLTKPFANEDVVAAVRALGAPSAGPAG